MPHTCQERQASVIVQSKSRLERLSDCRAVPYGRFFPHSQRGGRRFESFLHTSDTCHFACPDLESADLQAACADAVNVAAFLLTNSCTLSGYCPVSVSTSSDIRS